MKVEKLKEIFKVPDPIFVGKIFDVAPIEKIIE